MPEERKTLEELEKKYADVMTCEAITAVTNYVPTNDAPEFDEVEVVIRAKQYAPKMQKLINTLYGDRCD
jgi:hypothetical protein